MDWKAQYEGSRIGAVDCQCAAELVGQQMHQLQSQRVRSAQIEVFRNALPIIADGKDGVSFRLPELDFNQAVSLIWEIRASMHL